MELDVTPRVRPDPAVPESGSFCTVFAAFAFPSVDPLVELPVVVVLSAAKALPTPITAMARMLTPHSHTNPTRFMFRSPIWFLVSCGEHRHRARSPQVRLLHRSVLPDLVGRTYCDDLSEVERDDRVTLLHDEPD